MASAVDRSVSVSFSTWIRQLYPIQHTQGRVGDDVRQADRQSLSYLINLRLHPVERDLAARKLTRTLERKSLIRSKLDMSVFINSSGAQPSGESELFSVCFLSFLLFFKVSCLCGVSAKEGKIAL